MPDLVVTIDGPAGSGKSTIARLVAGELGAVFLDTGAMYRAVTVAAMRKGVDLGSSEELMAVLRGTEFGFSVEQELMVVSIDGVDITDAIRDPDVTVEVRHIACDAGIRSELVALQRAFAEKEGRIVAEGRDQGTVAFEDAGFKFFLTAEIGERARRRKEQLGEAGNGIDIAELERQIASRDASDEGRATGPLVAASDAVVVDTTGMNVEETVKELMGYILAGKDGG